MRESRNPLPGQPRPAPEPSPRHSPVPRTPAGGRVTGRIGPDDMRQHEANRGAMDDIKMRREGVRGRMCRPNIEYSMAVPAKAAPTASPRASRSFRIVQNSGQRTNQPLKRLMGIHQRTSNRERSSLPFRLHAPGASRRSPRPSGGCDTVNSRIQQRHRAAAFGSGRPFSGGSARRQSAPADWHSLPVPEVVGTAINSGASVGTPCPIPSNPFISPPLVGESWCPWRYPWSCHHPTR